MTLPVGHDVARIAFIVPCEVEFVLACFCVIFRYFKHNESRGRSFQDWQAAGKDSRPRRRGESNICYRVSLNLPAGITGSGINITKQPFTCSVHALEFMCFL